MTCPRKWQAHCRKNEALELHCRHGPAQGEFTILFGRLNGSVIAITSLVSFSRHETGMGAEWVGDRGGHGVTAQSDQRIAMEHFASFSPHRAAACVWPAERPPRRGVIRRALYWLANPRPPGLVGTRMGMELA